MYSHQLQSIAGTKGSCLGPVIRQRFFFSFVLFMSVVIVWGISVGPLLYLAVICILDWLKSLKQFFINVSYHILVASLTLMALF